MKKIDDQIQWYNQNANSLYDDLVSIELEKINSLYDRYEDHADELFVEEMIDSFCKIIERQREKIYDLETEAGMYGMASSSVNTSSSFGFGTGSSGVSQKGFQNDKQLQDAFTAYCLSNGKSSYTVNDYCSRIKNLWKTFYEEYQRGELPGELVVIEEKTTPNSPLLNAYHHTDVLNCYVGMKIAGAEGNRNWANTRAAFNKFDEFQLNVNK